MLYSSDIDAVTKINSEDLYRVISSKIECYGFEWIWNNLSEVARMAAFEEAVEEYWDAYFVAEEEKDEN